MTSNKTWNLTAVVLVGAVTAASAAFATEGGTTHIIPGSMATLADNAPAAGPGSFIKPMYLNYSGSASAPIPTAAGLAGNLDATANTFVVTAGYTFEGKVLGAAYTVVAALPYS